MAKAARGKRAESDKAAKTGGKAKDNKGAEVVPLRPTRPCPICGKPSTRANYPFCSQRCADIDLNRWLSGGYAIPASEDTPADDEVAGGMRREDEEDN